MRATAWFTGLLLSMTWALGWASQARADFEYDLTFSDGTKVKTVAPDTTYTLYLWAEITNTTTYNNDAWTFGFVSIDPTKVGAGAMYNAENLPTVGITGTMPTTHLTAFVAPGAQNSFTNFDDNVKGWGGASGASATTSGWTEWSGGLPPNYLGGTFDPQPNPESVQVGPNAQKVVAAIFTLQTGASVDTDGNPDADMTTFNVRYQATLKSGPIISLKGIDYYNDNTTLQNQTPTGQITDFSHVTTGTPVELLAASPSGSSVWTGTAATSTWSDAGNWQNNLIPGAASGVSNTDTATFNLTTATSPLTIDSGRNLQNITFDTAAVTPNIIGTTTGNAIALTNGGTIQTTASVVNPQTINAPLILEGTGGTYTFTSGATSSTATLSFGGGITLAATSGVTTLTLNGVNTGSNAIRGALADNGAGKLAVVVGGTSRWIFSGSTSTYTGGTTIGPGATLQLSGSVSALSPSMSIANSGSLVVASNANQTVGAITGAGTTAISSGSLTTYQIQQSSLSIHGTSTVTLVPSGSGSSTNPAAPNNINFSSNVGTLSIDGTMNAWTGTLDIGNNGLVVQYGSGTDPFTTITNMVQSGYANGKWTGTGITSSLAKAAAALGSPTPALNIGLVDFVPNTGTFGSSISFEGQTISTSAVLVRLTYMDDLVLSGDMAQANATSDALFFAANYGSGTIWHVGDITHDGVIDTNDALLFAANYVVGLPSLDGSTGDAAVLGGNAAVPEPASLGLLALGAAGLLAIGRKQRARSGADL